ncbi:MAG: glycerophosphodiester phosphodiesterase [Myxococcales bacterium]|nr:glycerophosphodiester phosphodiesterase [Myxococcales bacterium]
MTTDSETGAGSGPAVHPFLDHRHPIPFAHRGGMEAGPENTVAAFQAAYDLGFRWMETDVHQTRDGVLVAVHDASLERVANRDVRVSDVTWAELSAVDLGQGSRVPTFASLVERFPDVRWNIDPKDRAAVPPLVRLIRNQKLAHRVCIGSFSDGRLNNVRRALGDKLCTSLGPLEVVRLRARSLGLPLPARFHPCVRCAQLPVSEHGVSVTDAKLLAEAHQLGLKVHVWTIDDPAEMHRLLDLGVDGLMTDRPSILKAVLVERGQWTSPDQLADLASLTFE